MEFRILGPLEVNSDGQLLDLGGAKQRSLLAVLLLHANQVVSRDRLVEALWESEPPETANKALQVHVSALRKLLGKERLETRPPGYLLRVADDELDFGRFQRLREVVSPRSSGCHGRLVLVAARRFGLEEPQPTPSSLLA
jgi:DNA-binding SARP family transcriptional activator